MLSIRDLHLRAALFRSIRLFFHQQKFLEVDTPLRHSVILPEANIIPLMSGELYLQTSPELYMKRLLASGCGKLFQICPCFRKEECGRRHLEEFMMLEWYRLDADYHQLMEDCERLIPFILEQLCHAGDFPLEEGAGGIISSPPWRRLQVDEAFAKWSPMPVAEALDRDCFDELLVEYIEPKLGVDGPVFLYDYPEQLASLAKKKDRNDGRAERFELYIDGVEIANGFSELTDPAEQRRRFAEELSRIQERRQVVQEMPERFLQELGRIGKAAGIALGVDRLFMLLLGKESIAEAVTFSSIDG